MTRYTLRYRADELPGGAAFIVRDGDGAAYLFDRGRLRIRLADDGGGDADARLCAIPARRGVACVPVPPAAPQPLEDLRRLLGEGEGER